MRVLLVDSDSAAASSVELMLKAEGLIVTTVDIGEAAIDLAKLYDYDLVLLDLTLPDMSGLDVLRSLRAGKILTPVIVQTGSSEIDLKVKAFSLGADDLMTKPFHKDELVARIRAIVRRAAGHAESVITIGALAVNVGEQRVLVNGKPVHLTGKEYQMMELLALRKGTCLTKDMFMNHLYGGRDEPQIKIIDVFICKLRNKLRLANNGEHHIDSVWGRGYVMRDPERPANDDAAKVASVA